MIRITGDTHRDFNRFCEAAMPGESTWTGDDHLIVCGDFGYIMLDNKAEHDYLDYLETKPYTICFVDGNHENFPRIYKYPTERWNGGIIHRIRRNVIHLTRGQVFTIDGKKIFTMGGAYSIDEGARIPGITHWEEEIPDKIELLEAKWNLRRHKNKVDLMITHTTSLVNIMNMSRLPESNIKAKENAKDRELVKFLSGLQVTVDYSHWYFGHFHIDRRITDKCTALMWDVVTVE